MCILPSSKRNDALVSIASDPRHRPADLQPETQVCVPRGLGRGHRLEAVVDMAGTSLVKYRWEVEGAVST